MPPLVFCFILCSVSWITIVIIVSFSMFLFWSVSLTAVLHAFNSPPPYFSVSSLLLVCLLFLSFFLRVNSFSGFVYSLTILSAGLPLPFFLSFLYVSAFCLLFCFVLSWTIALVAKCHFRREMKKEMALSLVIRKLPCSLATHLFSLF